jgi:hypothetical protein
MKGEKKVMIGGIDPVRKNSVNTERKEENTED